MKTNGRCQAVVVAAVLVVAGCRDSSEPRARTPVRQSATATRPVETPATLLADGASKYSREAYDSAQVDFERALARSTAEADTASQASALRQLGLTSWRQDNYSAAQQYLDKAVGLAISGNLSKELPKAYNALGLLAHNRGRFDQALAAFTRGESAARSVNDSITLAKVLGNRGLVAADIGDFATARTGIAALRELGHDKQDTRLEANALGNLGMVEIRAGAPHRALALLNDALGMHRANAYAIGEENVLAQLGTAYQAMGEPQLAIAYLDSAVLIARRNHMRQQETEDLQLIAAVYHESGDHTRALEFLARASALGDSVGVRKVQGNIARAEARALSALGNRAAARNRVAVAQRFHSDAGAVLDELDDALLIAELAMSAGAREDSRTAMTHARDLVRRIDSRVARSAFALGAARVAELMGEPRTVLRTLEAARADLQLATTGREWEAPALAARAYAKLERLNEAVTAGRAAVRATERVRANIASGPLRVSYASERSSIYGDLVISLLRLGRTSEALNVADAARSRALLEHLAVAGSNLRAGAASDLANAERLLRRIDQLAERLRAADTTSPRRRGTSENEATGFLAAQLAESRRQYETLIRQTSVGDARAAALIRAEMPDAAVIASALGPEEALIEYFATADRLITFVVRSNAVEAGGLRSVAAPSGTTHSIAMRSTAIRSPAVRAFEQFVSDEAISSRVRVARELAGRRDVSDTAQRPVLRGLYSLLIQPSMANGLLDGVKRLIIVPHAALTYLPFAALIDPASGITAIEQFELLTLPSGASLPAIRRGPSFATGTFSAVTVFAPLPRELPGTVAESRALQRLSDKSRVYQATAATERQLRLSLAGTTPVHVATHGVFNPRSPMFSHLELVRPRAGPVSPDDDGRLEVHELLSLTIQSPLVFLSGCETGAGLSWSTTFARGEDYATLSEAFLFAGARNVVSTLWRIDDQGAAVFAERFYAALARTDPVSALAQAQRVMRADPAYRSPYYWAAYVISGEGRKGSPQLQRPPSVQ